jgi:hypothetical protein
LQRTGSSPYLRVGTRFAHHTLGELERRIAVRATPERQDLDQMRSHRSHLADARGSYAAIFLARGRLLRALATAAAGRTPGREASAA